MPKQKEEDEGKYALHTVIIKNTVPMEEATKMAQKIMRSRKRRFVRQTGETFRFRHIPKTKFIPRSFRTKVINDHISLVYGALKPENEHLEGSGMFDWFKKGVDVVKKTVGSVVDRVREAIQPRLNGYNNGSQATLNDYGDKIVKSLMIYRTPIGSAINTALNVVSLGKWNELRQKYGFDKLFHLSLVANIGGKNIIIEKNEVVNISTAYKTHKNTETQVVPLGDREFTVSDMLTKARETVGDYTFFSYDSFTNNCQFFIKYCLEAEHLFSEQAKDFLFQDLKELIQQLPGYVSKVASVATTTGAIVNKITGQGKKRGDGCFCKRTGGRARCACAGVGDCPCKVSGGSKKCEC